MDLQNFPETFDLLHLILAGLLVLAVLTLLVVATRRKTPVEDRQPTTPASAAETAPEPTPQTDPVAPAPTPVADSGALLDAGALNCLSLLQHEARLIDFLQEDLSGFSDADIGAAARVVHEGGQKALKSYLTLKPIHDSQEESRVTVAEGFNAAEIRLTGNISGSAPFTGTLIHRGWRVSECRLPRPVDGHDTQVLAPAEVEL